MSCTGCESQSRATKADGLSLQSNSRRANGMMHSLMMLALEANHVWLGSV
jgi:hypothetical protein